MTTGNDVTRPPDSQGSDRAGRTAARAALKPQPDSVALRRRSKGKSLEAVALPLAWIVVIAIFGVIKPDTFLTTSNFSSIFSSQAVLVVLSLALLIPLLADDFDLSVASVVGLSAMLIALLNVQYGLPVGLCILVAIAAGAAVGAVNAFFVVTVGIYSLIVTLGMGTFVTGIVLWISGTNTFSGVSNALVRPVIIDRLFGIPLAFYYAILCALIIWYILQFMPVGRRLLIVGRGRDVARLSGINVPRVRWGSFIVAGVLAALGGVLFAGTTGSAGPSSGVDLLLPAFAACFLGRTTISPGRFNVWGVVVAVYFLVTGTTGLQLLGAQSFVQSLFYGAALIIAVSFSELVHRRRGGV